MDKGGLEHYDVINAFGVEIMNTILPSDASLENAVSTLEVQKTRR